MVFACCDWFANSVAIRKHRFGKLGQLIAGIHLAIARTICAIMKVEVNSRILFETKILNATQVSNKHAVEIQIFSYMCSCLAFAYLYFKSTCDLIFFIATTVNGRFFIAGIKTNTRHV